MSANSTKAFSRKSATFLLLGAGLLVAGLSVLAQTEHLNGRSFVVEVPRAAEPTSVILGTSFEMPGQPARLLIPAIGVDAVIQSVGLSAKGDGSMGIPTNFTDVAWYNKGPLPGVPGSAVIAGHLDGRKVPRAVFYDLGKLVVGDLMEVVDQAGKTIQFRVVATKTYDYNASSTEVFLGDHLKIRLNLITCAGDWIKDKKSYDERIVVFTELAVPVE